jgi:hypothetical protein
MSDEVTLDDLLALPVAQYDDWGMMLDETPTLSPVYRIQERDERNGPKPTLKEGDRITYSRIVVRVGYEFGVHSVTRRAWWQAGLEIIAAETKLPIEQVKAVIVALKHSAPFKGIKDKIYKAKVEPLIATSALRNVRAMWFYDFPEPQAGEVRSVVTRLTGKRDPGHASGYYGEDWEPPTLYDSHPQRLLSVQSAWNWHYASGVALVYPEDAQQVKQ